MTIQDNVRAILETNFPCVREDLLDIAVTNICRLRPLKDTPRGKQVVWEGEKYVVLGDSFPERYMIFRSSPGNMVVNTVLKEEVEFTGKSYPGVADFLEIIEKFFEEEDHGND